MAKRSKTVAVVMGYDERRFGAYRAINYEAPEFPVIGVYHDRDSRAVVHVTESWDDAEQWCRDNA